MVSGSEHKNVKLSPPLGSVDEVTQHRLRAHITTDSFRGLPEKELLLLASRKSKEGISSGHWVKFKVAALAISVVRGDEQVLRAIMSDIVHHQRIGAVVVTGLVVAEHCGDDLNHYKNDCFGRVIVTEPMLSPRNGFLSGTFQLIRNAEMEAALTIHEGLEPF